MNRYIIFTLALAILFLGSCSKYYYKQAKTALDKKEYVKAIVNYKKVFRSDSVNAISKREIAEAYFYSFDYINAETYYKQALVYFPEDEKLLYQTALTLKMNDKCDAAQPYLQRYNAIAKSKNNTELANCTDFCKVVDKSEAALYGMEKLSFAGAKTLFNAVAHDNKWYVLAKAGDSKNYDIYTTDIEAKQPLTPLPGNVNTEFQEGPFTFDNTTGEMYYTQHSILIDKLVANKVRRVVLTIAKAKLNGGQWKVVENGFPYNSTSYSVGHPAITSDGKYLVFVSNQDNGYGMSDLYWCKKQADGKWSSPNIVPRPINSSYKEITPVFVAGTDSGKYTLSFSSNRPSENGGYDIYTAEFDGENFADPVHYGFPLNSSRNEYSLSFYPDKHEVVMASDRDVNQNKDEVYQLNMTNKVEGSLMDKRLNKLLKDQYLTLLDVKTGKKQNVKVDEDGKFQAILEPGKEYKLSYEAKGYEPVLLTLNSENKLLPVVYSLDVLSNSIKKDPIVMHAIYFAYNKAELNDSASTDLLKLWNTLITYSQLSIAIEGHTDSRGRAEYNRQLSEDRAKAVVNWLIAKGIDPARLQYIGYGEMQPVNGCIDGVKCTEEQYQQNRRTSFRITGKDPSADE